MKDYPLALRLFGEQGDGPRGLLGRPGDHRSDIYALGVMLYQLATGQLPYEADTPLAVMLKHVNEPLPLGE